MDDVRTERLRLRKPTKADQQVVIDIQTDPATHTHDRPQDEDAAKDLLASWLRHWDEHGFGYWIIEREGATLGVGGLQYKTVDGQPQLNLYFRLRPSAWGQGYAPEMAQAAIAWAERAVPEQPVWIITNVGNTAALRVAEKLGFTEVRQGDLDGVPATYLRR